MIDDLDEAERLLLRGGRRRHLAAAAWGAALTAASIAAWGAWYVFAYAPIVDWWAS